MTPEKQKKEYLHKTYEAIVDNLHIEIIGTSVDDAQTALKEWLDTYHAPGYILVSFKLKHNGIS